MAKSPWFTIFRADLKRPSVCGVLEELAVIHGYKVFDTPFADMPRDNQVLDKYSYSVRYGDIVIKAPINNWR